MAKDFGDARFEELEFLTILNRQGGLYERPAGRDPTPRRDMIASLVHQGFVNELDIHWEHDENRINDAPWGRPILETRLNFDKFAALSRVLGGQEVRLQISHRGRIRLSELRQDLQRNRIRDSFGILWDQRHVSPDLRIALLEATIATPLSVAIMDMNGLKLINDQHGHNTGNEAIKSYFQTVASLLDSNRQAYRSGGDEVVAILPATDVATAMSLLRHICEKVKIEKIRDNETELPPLSISAGVATTTESSTDEVEFLDRADKALYRAKNLARTHNPRPSSIGLDGTEDVVMI